MTKIYLFALLYLSLFKIQAYGQTHRLSYRFTTANANLPSNNIYKILSDSDGNIWLGTEKGIVKYDGTNFQTFNIQRGMADDDVVNLFYQPDKKSIWALTFNSKLSEINTRTNKFTNIWPDTKEKVIGAYMYAYQNKDTINFLNTMQQVALYEGKFSIRLLKNLDYKKFLFPNQNQDYYFNQNLFEEVDWELIKQKYFPKDKWWLKNKTRPSKYGSAIFGNEILFKNGHRIYRLLNIDKLIPGADKFIVDLEVHGSDLYIAIFGKEGGIYLFKNYLKNPTLAKPELISEKGYGISVTKDKIGNIWYTLQGKGLNVIEKDHLDVDVTLLPKPNNERYTLIKAPNDNVSIITNSSDEHFLLLDLVKKTAINYHKDEIPKAIHHFKSLPTFINPPDKALTKDISHDGRMYFSNSINYYDADFKTKQHYFADKKDTHVRGIRQGDYYQKKILFSTSDDSLYLFDRNIKKIVKRLMLPQIGTIKDIYVQNDRYILFCTSKGVFSTDFSFKHVKQLSKKAFNKVLIDYHLLYFINDNELSLLDLKKGGKITTIFSTKSFLLGFNILNFDISSNKMHLLTDVGYIALEKAKLSSLKNEADFNLASIVINDTTLFYPKEKIVLPELTSREILFNVQFHNPQHNNYQKSYSFEKQDEADNWINFTGNSFLQSNLSPGSYLLKINVNSASINLNKTIWREIIIKPKFWETYWFFILMLLILMVAVSYLTWLIVNHFQKATLQKMKMENRIADIENKAFLNQLNPHFLYNALNALQDYVIQKDTHNSIIYLQRIASLHRNILEFNQKTYITVAEEKAFLEKYLFIQQKRYSDKFSFEITLDKEITHSKLPPMLLQPLVENAIEHGFANSNQSNHVHINFYKDRFLKISIIDNGNADLKNLKQLKEGHALYMIKERLDFINQKKNTNQNTINFNANTPKGVIITVIIDL